MQNQDISIVDLIVKNKKEIYEDWIKVQLLSENLRDDLMSNEELKIQSKEFLDELIKSLIKDNSGDLESYDYSRLKEILNAISESRAQQGFTPTETATYIYSLKDVLLLYIQNHNKDSEYPLSEIINLNQFLDKLGLYTFEIFTKRREDIISRQQQEILELSTPVIQVWEGILAVPLIGTLDSMRSQMIMENLLKEITKTGAEITILDISGVPAMDTLVAQHIMKTVKAARLMGAECIISGIRPAIAQTIVQLGVDLSNVKTKASLEGALKTAFELLELKLIKK
jgi:rsbT co-antagonist protein RsbR